MKFKLILLKIVSTSILVFVIFFTINETNAYNMNEIKKEAEEYSRTVDVDQIQKEDILEAYEKIMENYSNDEIANMIEENKEEIMNQGISEEVVNAGENFIRTTDTEQIKEIIINDIDIEDIKNKIEQGYTPDEIISSFIQEMPTDKKIEVIVKVIFANKIVKMAITICIIWIIYSTIIRWILYRKAGKHGWAAIIPIYRQIVMYQICGLTPAFMILWFIPVFGWIIMFIMAIVKRFALANSFGRSGLFGLGLLLFPPIFQALLALNPNIEYEDFF